MIIWLWFMIFDRYIYIYLIIYIFAYYLSCIKYTTYTYYIVYMYGRMWCWIQPMCDGVHRPTKAFVKPGVSTWNVGTSGERSWQRQKGLIVQSGEKHVEVEIFSSCNFQGKLHVCCCYWKTSTYKCVDWNRFALELEIHIGVGHRT